MSDRGFTPSDAPVRRLLKITSLTLAVLAFAWALLLQFSGGFDTQLFGLRLTTNEPLRPLLFGSFALSVFILAGGIWRSWDRWVAAMQQIKPTPVAIGLALLTLTAGLAFGTTAASGADAYGYVSQADLWLKRDLVIDQPWMADVPWPSKLWTFSPLGYRPIEEPGVWAIVPTYSPGLPLLMAAAKLVAGHCAMFTIVPVAGGLLVLVTYGIGRRLGSEGAGLIGAWLVATSPAFLFMLVWPMTDVPVAAAWAIAFYFALGRSRWSILAAGLASAIAITIRPNLVLLAAAIFAAAIAGTEVGFRKHSADLRPRRDPADLRRRRDLPARFVIYALAVAPGIVLVALFNNALYGSPLTSGYGGLGGMFDSTHLWPNAKLYLSWFIESHTPFVLTGLAAACVPLRVLWPNVSSRLLRGAIALFVILLWTQYFFYLVFESWWYLRFLLASWPFIMIGTGAVACALIRLKHPLVTSLTVIAVIAVGLFNLRTAITRSAFELWQGERRYVSAARLVNQVTEPNAVIFSMQHSGSLRYYSGRISLRFDNLDSDWLDRAVSWLESQGVSSYLLVEDWEEPAFRRQFSRQARVAQLDLPPIFLYEGPAKIALYDLTRSRPAETPVQRIFETFHNTHCVPPAPARTSLK